MSHVATIQVEVTNLQDLRDACEELGLVFEENQKTYEWYGTHVGDYPLPEGFSESDLGQCEHAIRMSDQDRDQLIAARGVTPYEIGVVPRRDGKPGWTLLWDFYAGGLGLQSKIGETGGRLSQAVATAASIRTMELQGYRHQRQLLDNGTVKLVFQR